MAGPTMWSPQRQEGDTKIVGPAYTVKYVPRSDTTSPKQAFHYVSLITVQIQRDCSSLIESG